MKHHHHATVAAALCLIATIGTQTALAQATATVRGTVRDGYGSPIAAAEVTVAGSSLTTRTADDGTYTLRRVPALLIEITARRLGYVAASRRVQAADKDEVVADWILVPAATQMRPVSVTARRQPSDRRLEGFRNRLEAKRSGYFITREMIEQSPTRSLVNALRRVPGTRIGRETAGGTAVYFRGQDCSPVVFIDGFAATAGTFDFASLDLNMVEGIEVYLSSTSMPADFFASRGMERCGVVALWSRPAQPRLPVKNVNAITSHEEITAALARAGAYMSDDVEQTASMVSDPGVAYPDGLWSAGVSGEATLEFVVDTAGRIDWNTLSVISSTHDAFAQAVKVALVESRWRAARREGKRVAQIVQLPVYFNKVSATPATAPPAPDRY